jgi:hypothetical protein
MNRQTPSAVRTRMAYALYLSHLCQRALCDGADDETSRMIREQFRDVPGLDETLRLIREHFRDAGVDLDNRHDAGLLKGLLDSLWQEILSDIKLKSGARQNAEEDAEKEAAQARTEARAFQKNLRRDGYSAEVAWPLTAKEFKERYPDLYEGKTVEQLRRIWSR